MDPRLRQLELVAHRGYPSAFPENTLLGYRQAVLHGATYVETDIQCTRDGVPVLYHDNDTRRLSGVAGSVTGRSLTELLALNAHHPKRFGERFAGTLITTLEGFAAWLGNEPAVTAFIEIKHHSTDVFGIEPVMEWVMQVLEPVRRQCVVISFDDGCIAHAVSRYRIRTGWVLKRFNRRSAARARELAPDYLFVDDDKLAADDDPWPGPWQWAVYVVDDLSRALSYVDRGIRLVETDAIGDMMDQYRAGYLGDLE